MNNSTVLLTLKVFSATGGIEKVCRVAGKALYDCSREAEGGTLKILSMYDRQQDIDEKYFPAIIFRGFGIQKIHFIYAAVRQGIGSKLVIISHINLLIVGFLIKLLSPKTKLVLIAHGIEVWRLLPLRKRMLLPQCDQVVSVSKFTRDKMMQQNQVPAEKITVLNNCLDPFLPVPVASPKDHELLEKYGLSNSDIVLMTLSRLASAERYKGYDNVLYSIKLLRVKYPCIKYLVVGKYDPDEKRRLDAIIKVLALDEQIIFTGFIPDSSLAAHYNIADLYIMPSKKEGFGIVFIEALYYGKPVIAGNKDGSVDALVNGKFGLLIDPDNKEDIIAAIAKVIENRTAYIPDHSEVMRQFGYDGYKKDLKRILEDVCAV